MSTTTKKDLIDRIAGQTGQNRSAVKSMMQSFLQNVIDDLHRGDRLELRGFGVFLVKVRAARGAQNPRTLERVIVPERRTVKFRPGRRMREALRSATPKRSATARDGATIETFGRSAGRASTDRSNHAAGSKR